MAAYTITTDTNMDSLAGKGGGDTYNVNGAVLTIDGHSRYDANGSTSATIGTSTLSAALGGTVKIRADATRLLAFDTGATTVPAAGTVISQGGASGKLLGVYANLASTPLTAGAAMPTGGYILVKQWNAVAYSTGALTGISANVIADPVFGGTGRDGWIEVVFDEAKNMTLNRLNNQSDDVAVGADFYMGITDGVRATTYQIPSNGNRQYIGGVQVETAPGSGVYKWWPVTTCPMTSYHIGTTGIRGQQCHIDPINAVIRFGSDGTNSTGGVCPPAGCKVRIGNILMQNAAVASRTVNSFPGASGRYYIYPLGAGRYRMSNVSSALRVNILTNPYEVYLRDSSFCSPMAITSNAIPFDIGDCCISQPVDDGVTNVAFTVVSSTSGGTVDNSVLSGGNHANIARASVQFTGSSDITLTDTDYTGSGMPSVISTPVIGFTTSDRILIDGGALIGSVLGSGTDGVTIQNIVECAKTAGDPVEGSGNSIMVSGTNKSSDWLLDNWVFPYPECGSRGAFFSTVAGSNMKVRNMGSVASPVSTKGPTVAMSWTRSGAVGTFTKTGHGYRVGDYIYMYNMQLVNAALRIVTSVIDADTFTGAMTASGATSGTGIMYRSTCSHTLLVSASGSGSNFEFNNVHMDGAYTNSISTPVTCSGVQAYNITGGPGSLASVGSADMVTRGVSSSSSAPSPTSAQYGHCFLDGPITTLGTPVGSVTWTRSSGTMTVDAPGHGITVPGTRIRVYNSSNTAALPNQYRDARPINEDQFTISCAASGTTSGTLDWDTPEDVLTLFMNEQSATTTRYTIDSGTPAFTGAGRISATTVGDQITWEMPEYLINYTGFHESPPNTEYVETSLATGAGAYLWTYDIATDDGAFSGTFKNLLAAIGGAAGTTATAVVTGLSSTTGLNVGSSVWGAGVAQGARILTVDSGSQITLTLNHTDTVSGTLMFSDLPGEAFTTNFKLKVRLLTLQTNTLSPSYFNIPLVSDATSRAELYPISVDLQTQEVNLVNGVDGTRVQIYDLTSSTELVNDVVTFPFNWTDPNPYAADREIRLRAAFVDGDEAQTFFDGIIGEATNTDPVVTYRMNQVDDEVYNTNAVDGSTITFLTVDDGTNLHEIDEPSGVVSLQDWYAAAMYYRFTETGIAAGALALTAIDVTNYVLTGKQVKNTSSGPTVPLKLTGGWVTDGDTGDPMDIIDDTGGTIFLAPPHVVGYATGSGVTPTDIDDIAGAVWDEAVSGHVTAGTAGKLLTDVEATGDITQAKVNNL